jgi:serine/threonine-protein kinase
MIGKTIGHYCVVEKIGEGGMGVVYRAHDTRLDRDVALKLLPSGTLADEAARKRFRKEALALARLNHPNIATIHDFDTQDSLDFLVSEYISGLTLSEKLASGPLPEKEIARLGMQLAQGLAAAHEQGVIHRDLKPDNLRLTPDGRLKILDFGLAKLFKPAASADLTHSLMETQAGAGTLPYMAPEQIRGEPIDARTDIYAAGEVLYEMATDQRVFREKLSSRLMDDIVHKAPVSPRALNDRVSPDLERIILKCLEKEPERRYQSAKELDVDLLRLAAPASAPSEPATRPMKTFWQKSATRAGIGLLTLAVLLVALDRAGWLDRLVRRAPAARIESLAVLPLENLSRDPEQEYFTEGMTDTLITDLAQIKALRVISRTSVMRYKQTKESLPDIARALHVDAVVEGSVTRSGDRVRITAQLIEAATDRHLWAKSYDGDLRDVLALQSEVAQAIAREIEVKLTPQEQTLLTRSHAVNPEAYQLYLKGRFFWRKFVAGGITKSIEYYQQAIEKDPNYAAAYAGLADSYALGSVGGGGMSPAEGMPKARAAAQKAMELDDTLGEAHLSLALVRTYYDWDWAGADQEFRRAIELNPNYAEAHHWYSHYFLAIGRIDNSYQQSIRALELDPLSPDLAWHLGFHYYLAHNYDSAIEQTNKALELDPNSAPARLYLAVAYEQKGMFPQALAELQKARSAVPTSPFGLHRLAHLYALSGNRAEAKKILEQLEELSKHRYVSASSLAVICAGLGDKVAALTWLEKAYEEHAFDLSILKLDPVFDGLRSDPRFRDLVRRLNLPP